MFDDDRRGIARIFDRREADEQAVIAKFPRAALAVAGVEAAHLRRAGLARHLDAVERQAAAPRGSAGGVDDAVHPLARGRKGLGRKGQGFVRELPADEARVEFAARGDTRRHDGELERIHADIALADHRIQRIGRRPGLAVFLHLPRAVGDGAVTLVASGKLEFLAQPHHLRGRRDGVIAQPVGDPIEIAVAAFHDRGRHVDAAVGAETTEETVAEAIAADAGVALARVHAMFDRGDRGHRLQRRSRRVEAAGRLVDQRLVIVGAQPAIFGIADPVRKAVRIERGHRNEGEDVAIEAVDDDRRPRFGTHAARGIFLQIGVDGQVDGLALRIGLGAEIAHDLAPRGDFDALGAGLAAQQFLEIFLQPVLAGLEAGGDEERILDLFIFLGGRGADIADQVADRGAGGIVAGKTARRGNARQVGEADEDRCILLLGHVLRNRNRLESRCRLEVAFDARHCVAVELQQRAELAQNQFLAVHAIGNDVDAERHAVVGKGFAVAVDDPAAARGDERQIDAVAFGFEDVAIIVDDRDIAHPRRERGAHGDLSAADDKGAAREGEAPPGFGNGRTFLAGHESGNSLAIWGEG